MNLRRSVNKIFINFLMNKCLLTYLSMLRFLLYNYYIFNTGKLEKKITKERKYKFSHYFTIQR